MNDHVAELKKILGEYDTEMPKAATLKTAERPKVAAVMATFDSIGKEFAEVTNDMTKRVVELMSRLANIEKEVELLSTQPLAAHVELADGTKISMELPRQELVAVKLAEVAKAKRELEALFAEADRKVEKLGEGMEHRLRSLGAKEGTVRPRLLPKPASDAALKAVEEETEKAVREIAQKIRPRASTKVVEKKSGRWWP